MNKNLTAEQEAIRRAILAYYYEGHVQHDAARYEPILHPAWKFFLREADGGLRIIDRDEYLSWYDPADRDPALAWETEVYSIDVTDHIASVRLRLECQKVAYTDHFHMMKLDGRWQIVHKMSYGGPKSNG